MLYIKTKDKRIHVSSIPVTFNSDGSISYADATTGQPKSDVLTTDIVFISEKKPSKSSY